MHKTYLLVDIQTFRARLILVAFIIASFGHKHRAKFSVGVNMDITQF
jgi:hypothetical protein